MSYDASESTLEARIDRLESLDEIRQLAAKYSLSLDMRDLDAHVNLFAPDIRVSRDKIGSCLLYTSPSPRDRTRSRMPSSA